MESDCCPRGVGSVCGRSLDRGARPVGVATNEKCTRAVLARLGFPDGNGSFPHRDANPQNVGQSEGQECRVHRFASATSQPQCLVGGCGLRRASWGSPTGETHVPARTANAAAPTPDGRERGYSFPLSFMR